MPTNLNDNAFRITYFIPNNSPAVRNVEIITDGFYCVEQKEVKFYTILPIIAFATASPFECTCSFS